MACVCVREGEVVCERVKEGKVCEIGGKEVWCEGKEGVCDVREGKVCICVCMGKGW